MNRPVAASGRTASIVVIEDEADISEVVEYNLERAGHRVRHARDGWGGLRLVRELRPDLVVLDVMLPELDGIEVCRALRRDPDTVRIPIIMLTARADEADVILGLGAGADDYVAKPFRPRELVARIDAVLRRGAEAERPRGLPASASQQDGRIARSGVVVDPSRHEVTVGGVRVRFTRMELAVLHALMSAPGRVFGRDQLLARVTGGDVWITERTIDVHIRAIRKKLGSSAWLVETVRGVGYRFHDELA